MPRTWSPLLDLHLADQLVTAAIVAELQRIGLQPHLLALLALIRDRGRITPTELARAIGFHPSKTREMVRELLLHDHVRRIDNPADRRSHFLELTPAGETFVDEAWVAVLAVEEKLGMAARGLGEPLRLLYEDALALEEG